MVLSCFVVMVTHDTLGWTTILLVWLGHVTVTGAELFQSAGHWGLTSELSEPARRAEYQGAGHVGGTLGSVWAPALFTFLAMEWGTDGLAAHRGHRGRRRDRDPSRRPAPPSATSPPAPTRPPTSLLESGS